MEDFCLLEQDMWVPLPQPELCNSAVNLALLA